MADVYRFVPKDGHLMDKADSLRCYMFFQDSPCYRVNSLARYSDVNKAVCDVTTVALRSRGIFPHWCRNLKAHGLSLDACPGAEPAHV
jgi:hypothetical protein